MTLPSRSSFVAALHDLLLQLEAGDAVDQQAADAVVAVVDRDLIALAAQLLGGGQPGRAGADDADALGRSRRGWIGFTQPCSQAVSVMYFSTEPMVTVPWPTSR